MTTRGASIPSPDMRDPARQASPWETLGRLWELRESILFYTRREVAAQYKESVLGFLWVLIQPAASLAVYMMVRGLVFRQEGESLREMFIVIAAGVLIYRGFSSVVSESSALIRIRRQLVQRTIFPLEMIPVARSLAAMFDMAVGWILTLAVFGALGWLSPTSLLSPLLLLPLVVGVVGVSWLLAAAGVFLGDLKNVVPIVVHLLFFLTPVIYTVDMVPAAWRWLAWLNPLTSLIEAARAALLGTSIPWAAWTAASAVALGTAWVGLAVFNHTRSRFADVI